MIRSLRWRLQLWHAAVLMTVLIMFGVAVYPLQWQTRLQQTDAELDRVAAVLISRVRGLFPGPPRNGGPGGRRPPGRGPIRPGDDPRPDGPEPPGSPRGFNPNEPPPPEFGPFPRIPFRDGFREAPRDGREGPRDPGRDGQGLIPRFVPPPGLGLPEEFKHLFEGDNEESFYYIIWDQNGAVLANSKPVDGIPFPALRTGDDHLPVRTAWTRGINREVVHVVHGSWRGDINVQVGRSMKNDLEKQYASALRLAAAGLGVLVIGLAGGWWFSSRAIRPIADMSAIAESISVKNLSKRINVKSTATELEQLAIVLNRTFDRLQSAFERQSQFTADASHELRTPLSVILSHAELALARPRSPDDYQSAFRACQRAAMRMKSLIDSLLLLARFDSIEPELDRRSVELDRMAQEAVDMLQPLAVERNVFLTCHTQPVAVRADWERLFQVLSNLLSNAIRYNRPEGTVDLSVSSENGFAIIRVADMGVGIAAEDLTRIFDRFYRVDKARSQAEGGCGLGLSICQTIVEAHHGTITATSELGVGTTIEVRLPINLEESTTNNTNRHE